MATIVCVPSVRNVFELLEANPDAFEFIVQTADGGLEGTVERLVLLRLIECRLFGREAKLLHPTMVDSAWPNLRNNLSPNAEISLRNAVESDYDIDTCVIDLRPYVDSEPAIVLSSSSMRKAHAHIRNGERNVLVAAPNSVKIIGVVKRHDIMPGALDATLLVKRRQQKKEMRALYGTDEEVKTAHAAMVVANANGGGNGDVEMSNLESGGSDQGLSNTEAAAKMQAEFDNIKLDPFEPRFYTLLGEYIEERHHRAAGAEADEGANEKLYDLAQKPRRNDFRKMRTYSM
jgi:hypothetical protein